MTKTSLVLISGLLSHETLWRHQARYLNDIASIQIFNPSEETADRMVEAILQKAPPKFALAGHSMGGWVCLEILRKSPSRVEKVCLLNTTARDDSKEKAAKRKKLIERCKEGEFQKVVREIASLFTQDPRVGSEAEKMFLEVGEEAFIRQEMAMMRRQPCESILPSIRCPALAIHASQDKNFSLEEHKEMVGKIPNAKLAIVEDSGHMSPMESPQAVTALMRFWLTYF